MQGNHLFPGLPARSGNEVTGMLGARMTERESMAHVRREQETPRAKSGKGKSIIKRGKAEVPSQPQEQAVEGHRPRQPERVPSAASEAKDPQLMARIQQRAYQLYEAGGFEQGRELEHWLEAERQSAGSSERSER